FQPNDGYHDVPPPYTGTFMPPKPYLHVETSIPAATPKPASPKSTSSGKRRNRKACFVCKSVDYLIKDCDYHAKKMAQPTTRNHTHMVLTQSKPVSITDVRPVSVVVPQIKDKGVINSGCLRHMTGNMSYLSDFEEIHGGYVAFGGNPKGGKISRKGKIRTCKLDFDDVYFVKELKFNLFSVSQMFQPSDGYHDVPPPYTGTFMPPKPYLVFNTASIDVETDHFAFTVQLSPAKPEQALSHTNRPTAPIIED
nr:ribonuclease H-like domain-containing protein [Tanacetum cinerariifolium]